MCAGVQCSSSGEAIRGERRTGSWMGRWDTGTGRDDLEKVRGDGGLTFTGSKGSKQMRVQVWAWVWIRVRGEGVSQC